MFFLPPILLHYYITYRCNCKCCFCDIWRLSPTFDAQVAHVEANLNHARRLGARFVDFTGGEPLLHQDLPELLVKAQNRGFRTSVTTNTILYPERAKELKGKIDLLHFSLDATCASMHDHLRRAPAFEQVLISLDIARQIGETPDILFTVTPETISFLPLMVKLASSLQFILIVNPIFSPHRHHRLYEDNLRFIEKFKKYPYVYINTAFHTLRRQGGNQISKPRCRVMASTIVISPDNQLMLPCFHRRQLQIPLHNNLDEIWLHQRVKYLAWQGRLSVCAGCIINCYFDPSFCYKVDRLFFQSLSAKIKYAFVKYALRKYHLLRQPELRPTKAILAEINANHLHEATA